MIKTATLTLLVLGFLLLVSRISVAEEPTAIRTVPLNPTQQKLHSGEDLYRELCAVCHGISGEGNGPAARLLTPAPPDLTRLAFANGGEFPSVAVINLISGQFHSLSPETEMPAWERVFFKCKGDLGQARHRVYNLAMHLKSIQNRDEPRP